MDREVKRGPEDDRQDQAKRDRIDDLVVSTERWRENMDRRWRRVAILLVVMLLTQAVAVAFGYLTLQGDRWTATRQSCERQNATSEAVVGLLKDLGARAQVVELASRRFPHVPPFTLKTPNHYTGPMTCSEQATQAVWGPRL